MITNGTTEPFYQILTALDAELALPLEQFKDRNGSFARAVQAIHVRYARAAKASGVPLAEIEPYKSCVPRKRSHAQKRLDRAEAMLPSILEANPMLNRALSFDIRVSGSNIVEAFRASLSEPFQVRNVVRPQGAEMWENGVPHTTRRPVLV